jgi:hypothetical protein
VATVRRSITALIDNSWQQASFFKREELQNYTLLAARARQNSKSFANTSNSILRSKILKITWAQYLNRVKAERPHPSATKERIALLSEIQRLFRDMGGLSRMTPDERRLVAGFGGYDEFKWGWFGSTNAVGAFKQLVNNNSPALSRALDRIRIEGVVTREDYEAFVKSYISAFPGGKRHGLGPQPVCYV